MESDEVYLEEAKPRVSGIGDYFWIIRERCLWGLASGVLLGGLVALYMLNRPREYTSSLQLLVGIAQAKVLDLDHVVDEAEVARSTKADSLLKQHLIELQSRTFRSYLIKSLSETDVKRMLEPYNSTAGAIWSINGLLQSVVAITLTARDMVYTISVTHRDATVAAEIANRYASKYIEYTLNDVGNSNASALTFLRENAEKLQQSNLEAKRALQRFREENGIMSVDESRRIAIDRIIDLNAHRSALLTEKTKHEAVLEQLRARGIEREGFPDDRIAAFFEIEEIASSSHIRQIKGDLDAAVSLQKEIDQVYLERHPKYIENTQRISDLRARLKAEILVAFNSLLASVKQLDARIARNAADLAAMNAETQRLDELGITYRRLETRIANEESMLKRIEDRLNETVLSTQLSKTNLRVIDPAVPSSIPSAPNRKKSLMTAGFLFMIGFVGVPIVMSRLDDRVTSAWDVEQFIGKPLIGEVRLLNKQQAAQLPILVASGNDPLMVDTFRSIYSITKLSTSQPEHSIQVVTSTIPREGKTMFCMNYAAVVAQHGKRVLLVDCDLRKPRIQQYMRLGTGSGLVDWLIGGGAFLTADLHEKLGIRLCDSGVFFLPAGSATTHPTEEIESDRFRKLINYLSENFDHIVIDSPPLGVFPDAMFLANHAHDVIYIVNYGKVSRQAVKECVMQLENTPAKVCGIVINRRKPGGRPNGYYGYRYSYASKYKRYYATSPKSPRDDAAAAIPVKRNSV